MGAGAWVAFPGCGSAGRSGKCRTTKGRSFALGPRAQKPSRKLFRPRLRLWFRLASAALASPMASCALQTPSVLWLITVTGVEQLFQGDAEPVRDS